MLFSSFSANSPSSKGRRPSLSIKAVSAEMDRYMLLLILSLIIFGSIMVFSASYAYSEIRFNDPYYFARKQILWVFIGLIAMYVTSRIPTRSLRRAAVPLYAVTLLLLALVPLIGSEAGGAKRWISIGAFTFQPSELGKTALILMLALFYATYEHRIKSPKSKKEGLWLGILAPFLLIGGVCGLVLPEKHLSCIIIVGLIGLSMMFLCGSSAKILAALCGVAGVGVGIFATAVEYTRRRIIIWRNPELYPRDGGWQTLQGLMAIGSGGLFGLGLGNSRLKYLYVSEPQNDFIFTITCEELGFLGAGFIILLFALFTYRGFTIARSHPDSFASFAVMGLVLKVALQALLNICVITNTLPNTGISLPFFSYGGSSLVMLFAEMGIILSASREARIRH